VAGGGVAWGESEFADGFLACMARSASPRINANNRESWERPSLEHRPRIRFEPHWV